jgi:putative transposase
MTTVHDIDLPTVLADRLTTTDPDVLRELLTMFLHTLMGAEADALCGAGYGERSTERTNHCNGYRHREFDTRTGTLDLAIPKLRQGSYFPEWLLERRKRAERALTTVVATCDLLGVSTRRMDKLVETLGITSLSKSQVSVMAKELDTAVEAFRSRPLDAGPYTFVAADALVGEGSRSRPGGQRARADRHRRQRRGLPRNPGHRRHHRRGRRGLVGLLAVADRPGPVRGQTGHQRCARRAGRRDRRHRGRSDVAALPHALRDEPDGHHPQGIVAVGAHPAALGLRPTRR